VPGYAALPHIRGGWPRVGLSCAAPGYCTASGYYSGTSVENEYPFAFSEVHGAWGRARLIPGLAALERSPHAVMGDPSCAKPGDCTAVGYTEQSAQGPPSVTHVFAASQVRGAWRKARPLPGFALLLAGRWAYLAGLSCAAPGDCTAVGYYAGHYTVPEKILLHAAVASQVGGRWRPAQALHGITGAGDGSLFPSFALKSVSCVAPGDCTAGGSSLRHGTNYPIVMSQVHGTWASPRQVAGVPLPAWVDTVACTGPGSCAAVVSTASRLYVASMVRGRWGAARPVPGLAALARYGGQDFSSLACASPGNCAMGGSYWLARMPASGNRPPTAAFVVAEVNGAWGKAIEAPGTAVLNTGGLGGISQVSCAPRGPCTAAGSYGDRSNHTGAYFLSEAGGAWGRLQQVRGIAPLTGGSSGISSLSCPRAGRCSAVGLYTMGPGLYYLFDVSQRP
jgi:hypothetical protein